MSKGTWGKGNRKVKEMGCRTNEKEWNWLKKQLEQNVRSLRQLKLD